MTTSTARPHHGQWRRLGPAPEPGARRPPERPDYGMHAGTPFSARRAQAPRLPREGMRHRRPAHSTPFSAKARAPRPAPPALPPPAGHDPAARRRMRGDAYMQQAWASCPRCGPHSLAPLAAPPEIPSAPPHPPAIVRRCRARTRTLGCRATERPRQPPAPPARPGRRSRPA